MTVLGGRSGLRAWAYLEHEPQPFLIAEEREAVGEGVLWEHFWRELAAHFPDAGQVMLSTGLSIGSEVNGNFVEIKLDGHEDRGKNPQECQQNK
jgi:hypothetical protein